MKFYKLVNLFWIIILFSSCKPFNDSYFGEPISKESYRVSQQTISFADSANQKVIFNYENESDFFPISIHFVDSAENITKVIINELNEWRMPRKQIAMIADSIIETTDLSISPRNYFLLEKTVYSGVDISANKTSHTRYEYDDNDFLLSVYTEYYSKDTSFVNCDSSRIVSCSKVRVLPANVNRKIGNYIPFSFTEFYIKYWTNEDYQSFAKLKKSKEYSLPVGAVYQKIEASFDTDGFPAYSVQFKFDSTKTEQWYKTDKDGLGQVVELVSYDDFSYNKLSRDSKVIKFTYDECTVLQNIKTFLYDPKSKKYDRLESDKYFSWFDFQLNNPQNFLLMKAACLEKYYDYTIGDYMINENRIVQYDKDAIIEEFYQMPYRKNAKQVKPYKIVSSFVGKIKLKQYRGL